MSLTVTKAGLLSTVQDGGRYGHQHLGINLGGSMDRWSAGLANVLLGNDPGALVLELHHPGPELRFEAPCLLCLAGADFSARVNGQAAPLHQPLLVPGGSVLQFGAPQNGVRCYLALLNPLRLTPWLGSHSTHLKVGAGGFKGRALQAGDVLPYEDLSLPNAAFPFEALPWRYPQVMNADAPLRFLPGPEWDWLTPAAQQRLITATFQIGAAERMGYRLEGPPLERAGVREMVSSGVTFGTVQCLPNGQLVVLMADHQTTGGYPRVAQITGADLPQLAQRGTRAAVRFEATTLAEAQAALAETDRQFGQWQKACTLKREDWLLRRRT